MLFDHDLAMFRQSPNGHKYLEKHVAGLERIYKLKEIKDIMYSGYFLLQGPIHPKPNVEIKPDDAMHKPELTLFYSIYCPHHYENIEDILLKNWVGSEAISETYEYFRTVELKHGSRLTLSLFVYNKPLKKNKHPNPSQSKKV